MGVHDNPPPESDGMTSSHIPSDAVISASHPTMFPEVDDPKITDAQLGSLVRRYEGLIRPPLVVTVRSRWYEIALVIGVILLAGAIIVGSVTLANATYGNRRYVKNVTHILCDKNRIGGVESHPDPQTQRICAEQLVDQP